MRIHPYLAPVKLAVSVEGDSLELIEVWVDLPFFLVCI